MENRDPEKPEVCELGLRLRSPPGTGEEEAGEGPALVPSGWQPEEEVEPLPRSSLELESSACTAASIASSLCKSLSRSSSSLFCCFLLRLIFFLLFLDSLPICCQSQGHTPSPCFLVQP